MNIIRLIALLPLFASIPLSNYGGNCAWNNQIFKDGEIHINGHVCQLCNAGVWIDHIVDCKECTTAHPDPGNLPAKPDDCKYPQSSGYTYSNGAWIFASGKDQVCGQSIWNNQTPPQVCNPPNTSRNKHSQQKNKAKKQQDRKCDNARN
jgi:hypothetical protein